MYKVTSRWPHQDSIKVEWNLGKRCNYDCSYCPAEIHDNSSPHTNLEILKRTIDQLSELGKPIRISFTGGEPTVHPDFREIVQYAKFKGIPWISVTTNGTLPFEFYNSLPVDQYVFSIHFEFDWRRVVKTLEKLAKDSNRKLIGQIMAHHKHMKAVKHVHGILLHDQIPCTVRRIRWTEGDHDLFDDMRYHPDDLKWIKAQEATVSGNCVYWIKNEYQERVAHSNDLIKLHMNQFKDWTCYAGIESLMINWDGDVHRATCRVGGGLGNIYEGTFDVPSEPIVCDRNFCTCSSDIPLTKTKAP